jgi:anti-sigma regulatory factor (Ser/Thr protein kinase)
VRRDPHASASSVVRVTDLVDARTCASLARRVALDAGFAPHDAAEIGTCASELATNVARHGGGGTVEVRWEGRALVIRALDHGNAAASELLQRVSRIRSTPTHPSALHGLGVLVRWMDELEVRDVDGGGLDVRARRALTSPDVRRR